MRMESDDVVHPADAQIHELLGRIADNTEDEHRRERLLELMVMLPPSAEWPPEFREKARETYEYIRGLRRDLERRELEHMYSADREPKGSDER